VPLEQLEDARGVQARNPRRPATRLPILQGCRPSTSFAGAIAACLPAWPPPAAAAESCTRMPSTSGRAFNSATVPSNSSVVTESGGVSVSDRMPNSWQALTLLRT